jgi:hypothetical protein
MQKIMNKKVLIRWLISPAALILVIFFVSACSPSTPVRSQIVSFRLCDSQSGKVLSDTIVSIYDGHDRNISSDPRSINNAPYHFADMKTSSDGILYIDLARLKDRFGEILLQSDSHYKYIHAKRNTITVLRYIQQGYSLRVVAHHNYNIEKGLVTTITFPNKKVSEPKKFEIIEVPMDRNGIQPDNPADSDRPRH